MFDIRYGAMAGIFLVSIFSFSLFKKGAWKFLSKSFLIICVLVFLFNSYWMIPALRGSGSVSESLQSFSRIDIDSFFTRADQEHGILWNTAAMYGFWGDNDHRYTPQKFFVSYWFYLFFIW